MKAFEVERAFFERRILFSIQKWLQNQNSFHSLIEWVFSSPRQASKRTDYWVPLVICKERWKFSQLLFAGLKMQHMITSAFCVSCCCCCCCLPLPGKKKRKKSFFLYFSIMLKNTTWILCSMQKHFPVYVPAIRKYWMLKSVPVEQA